MDDLEELQSRVAAAQEKLRLSADDQRKYGLRLNDVVAIVEGSLARQQEEMKRLQATALELRIERDTAQQAEAQLKSAYEAILAKLATHQAQNEQLRAMVLTLLNVIEGREPAAALQSVMQRLETSLKQLSLIEPSQTEADVASITPFPAPVLNDAATIETPETSAAGVAPDEQVPADIEDADVAAAATEQDSFADQADNVDALANEDLPDDAEDAGLDAEAVEPELAAHDIAAGEELPQDEPAVPAEDVAVEAATSADQIDAAPLHEADELSEPTELETSVPGTADDTFSSPDLSDDQPEDLETISMTEHESLVADPELTIPAAKMNGHGANGPAINGDAADHHDDGDDEPLVSALLDAEKALIEAGANGFANGSSPVAEIIRRISMRTRELSEASGS